MKTLIHFVTPEGVYYFIVPGNWTILNGVYVGRQGINLRKERQLSDLLYDEKGLFIYSALTEVPAKRNWDFVINCGSDI